MSNNAAFWGGSVGAHLVYEKGPKFQKIVKMEINFKIIVLIISILFTGLTAGLCFTWSNAVTPGIGRLDNISFLKAFQAMNRAIINGPFMLVFMGGVIGTIVVAMFLPMFNISKLG